MIAEIGKVIGGDHYLAFMLILIFSCVLTSRNILSERVNQKYFWFALLVCALLIVQDILENAAQLDPARRELRMITSIAGYTLRPAAVLGFLLVIWPANRQKWFLWIPAAVNGLLYGTALFLPLTFYFDEAYGFHRGPLAEAAFIVSVIYLILIFFTIHRRFRDRRFGDIFVIYLCALGCIGAMVMDIFFEGMALVCAILISSLIFYLFLRSQDMDHDPLTRLWNRRVFYEDCKRLRNTVTAVASVDMNGLKKTNDELGHESGDRALRIIGRGLLGISGKKAHAYRIGGDEFMVLFIRCDEEEITQSLTVFMDEIWQSGLSVAMGLTTTWECGGSLEEMIRISDQRMYADKSKYYQLHDRRRRR